MGKVDKTEKSLEDYNDVFKDIVNVLLFDGEDYILEEELEEASPYSNYTANGKIRDQERDVVKFWKNNGICIATIGFENETQEDRDMPLRILSYDGAFYRSQFSPRNNKDRFPVVSLVLYYGYKHKWREPRTLKECLLIPDKLNKFVSDYRMNLFEIAYLSDEQVKRFKSDFRLVVDYFVQMRKTGNYIPPSDDIVHVQEVLSLMSALTNDSRFSDVYDSVKGKEKVNMCEVLDRIEEKGISKGIEKGIEIGRDDTLFSLVKDNLLDITIAANRANKTLDQFQKEMQEYLNNKA